MALNISVKTRNRQMILAVKSFGLYYLCLLLPAFDCLVMLMFEIDFISRLLPLIAWFYAMYEIS